MPASRSRRSASPSAARVGERMATWQRPVVPRRRGEPPASAPAHRQPLTRLGVAAGADGLPLAVRGAVLPLSRTSPPAGVGATPTINAWRRPPDAAPDLDPPSYPGPRLRG